MISIIVPIYNVENYLAACVDSILNSTYRNIEAILVDDGSTDGSGAICDKFAAQDNRVRTIHQENKGVSAARNLGMKSATGEYIAFVDGDDVIHPKMFEVLYNEIKSGEYDFSMVYGVMVEDKGIGYNYVSETDPIVPAQPRIITREEYIQQLANLGAGSYQYHVIWNKLYKRAFVEGHEFKKMPFEDVEWLNRVNLKLRKGIILEVEMYYYIQWGGSTMHTDMNRRKIARINNYYTCLKEIPAELPSCRAIMLKALYSVMFENRHTSKATPWADEVEAIVNKTYQETKDELIHSQLSWTRKLRNLCFYHFPGLYDLALKLRYGLFK